MAKVKIENLKWGLNLQEPSTLEDNQFEELTNMSYDADGRLITRRGIKTFGNPVPSGKPQTSYFFYKNDKTLLRTAIITSGTEMYKYNEGTSDWDSIKTGLTEFEADGVTRTRWSFAVYLEKIYMCNGIDSYAEYDPATNTYTEIAGQPKVRYLAFLWDSIYGAGDDDNPNLLYATNAGATDGQTLNANDVFIWWESDGRINCMEELQQEVLVFKGKKVFNVPWDLSSATALDAENWGYGERSVRRVGNSLVYFNDRWFNTLKAKSGITGTSAIQDEPLSDNVRKLTSIVTPKEYNSTIWTYILPLTNYYGSFDTGIGGVPDTTLVYSSLTKVWSRYNYPAHYDFGVYENEDGTLQYIMTSATSNQVFEMEAGFDDLGSAIEHSLTTKRFDLWDAMQWATHTAVDLQGLKSEWWDIDVEIFVEGQSVGGSTITDDFTNITSSVLTLWTRTIGSLVIWGWAISDEDVDLFKYFIRIPLLESGSDIQIRMTSEDIGLVWSLDKVTLHVDEESSDLFEYGNIG